jgi:hypothetical protein
MDGDKARMFGATEDGADHLRGKPVVGYFDRHSIERGIATFGRDSF